METDLSLIEISGEDDSLLSLQHSPLVSNNSPYFSCSPLLQIPRSTSSLNPTPRSPFSNGIIIKDEKDTYTPTYSLCKDIKDHNVYKENINANKSEAPKLSIEPQSMKKKKKGGGFNLRKSLAWDRAFFTEEGVLDPLELSMLSGNALSIIHEGRESLSSELDGPSASPGPRALKHNLYKELPSSARKEGSKLAGKMSPKLMCSAKAKMHPASPQNMKGMKLSTITEPCSQAKRKVLSAHDINRSSSKRSGCSRSLVSSLLKRTSNTNVTAKEPRVPKQLDTKNEPLVVSKTSRSSLTGASHTKRNFSSQPATGQKNIGIKGISSSAKSCQNGAKTGPGGKLIRKSTAQPARSMLKVAAEQEMHSSTGLQPPKVSLENNSSEGLPDAIVPAAADPLNGHDSTSRKHASSLPQTTCYYGENKQHPQTQIAKPSGLRMPSPSLGFFGQSKSSNSHGELHKGLPSCNFPKDCIPTVSKASVLNSTQKPPRPSRKIPPCSGTVGSFTSTMNDASCGIIKSELNDIQTVPLQVNSETSNTVNSEQKLANVDLKSSDDGDACEKVEKLSCIENIGLQINDIKLPPQSGPCEQLEKHDGKSHPSGPCEQLEKHDGKSVVDVCPISRDSTGARLDLPHSLPPIPLFVESSFETNNTFVKQHVEDGKCKQPMKSSSDPDHISSEVHGEQLTGLDEFELSPQQAELKKPGTCRVDPISEILSQGLVETSPEESRSSEKSVKDYISNAEDNVLEVQDCGTVSYCPTQSTEVEHTKDETDCLNGRLHVEEVQISQNNCETPYKDCLQYGKSSEEYQQKKILQSVNNVESRASGVFCSLTSVNQDCNFVASGKMEYRHVENSCTASPLAGNFKNNVELCGEAIALELDTIYKCDIICDTEVAGTDNTAKEPLNGDALRQFLEESSSLADSNKCNIDSSTETNRSLLVVNVKSRQDTELQNRDLVIEQVPLEKKQDTPETEPPPNAIPFSVDWLAAVEAVGEEILGRKGGAVQNSPTDKSSPDFLNGGLHVGEVQMLSVEASFPVVSCKSLSDTSADSNSITFDSPRARYTEQTEVPDSCFVTDQVSKSNGKCSEESPEKNFFSELQQLEASYSPEKEIIVLHSDFSTDLREHDEERAELIISCSNEVEQMNRDSDKNVQNYGPKCGGSLNEKITGTSSGTSQEPYGTILPLEGEININQSKDSFDSELIDRLCSDVATLSLNKAVEEKKQDTPVIKPPSNAVPFSDEWLAALEAAGEEILARKGGAVQNSPTDKSSPQPNPWSPVKRKNNQGLGPFDCTKFINPPTDPSSTQSTTD